MNHEIATKSIKTLSSLIRNHKISPVELLESALFHIETFDGLLNAYINVYSREAKIAAKKAEIEILKGNYRSVLHGIPLAIKDNIYFKNKTTTMGSSIHQKYKPNYNATVIEKLKNAGSIFTGKTNMHEYATGITTNNPHYGPSRNPWDPNKIPGGSSGGSGVAVSSNMSIASLGTDTGGSVRIPSSLCGIVGLKPTYGRISKYGCFPEAWTLDHVGLMTKTVYDAAILLELTGGFDKNDPASVNIQTKKYTEHLTGDINGLVIGVNEDFFLKDVDSTIKSLVLQGIKNLELMGARTELVDIPTLKDSEIVRKVTDLSELSAVHHYNLKSSPKRFGDDTRLLLEMGEIPSAVDYLRAQQMRRKITSDFENIFHKVDVLITPTLPIATPKIGEEFSKLNGKEVDIHNNMIRFVGPANLTGLPALSVPCGFKDGMPVGMQIIGPAFKEETILNMGYAFERTNPLNGKAPNLGGVIKSS